MDAADIDHNFEPQTRARSNTWPLRPNRELEPQSSPTSEDSNPEGQKGCEKDPLGLNTKKSGSRRNAWGNLSYADLITKAIQSSPEKRLTLSQIYDWMVQNVPYFKDKGDSTSSAGWKNSIRHNLSLHSRFMRIQNEGTGKSSWWVINPDAKPGKAPRRRAGSMETKHYEKKRGRVKKKVEALQAALENGGSPSTGSDDYLDNQGYGEFRQRTSSNASSCGRLSPIHAGMEPDLHDNQVPPMSPIPWGAEVDDSQGIYHGSDNYSELVDSLVDGMKLSNQENMDIVNGLSSDTHHASNGLITDFGQSISGYMNLGDTLDDTGHFLHLPAPPPYPEVNSSPQPQQQSQSQPQSGPQLTMTTLECSPFPNNNNYHNLNHSLNGYRQQELFGDSAMDRMGSPAQLSINTQQQHLGSPDGSQQGTNSPGFTARVSPQMQRSSSQPGMSPLGCQLSPQSSRSMVASPAQRNSPSLQVQQQAALQQAAANASILREALTRGALVYRQPTTTTNNSPYSLGMPQIPVTTASNNINSNMLNMGISPHHMQQQQLCNQQRLTATYPSEGMTGCGIVANGPAGNCNNNIPLDIDMDSLISVDYDMDQVIKHELSLEGNLDFNFEPLGSTTITSQNIVH